MDIKIIAFDLDGTTIISNKDLPKENSDAMKKAYARGVHIVPATGRIKTFLPDELASMSEIQYVISCNGASVDNIRTSENIYKALIDTETALKVQEILSDYDIYIEYYCDGQAYTLLGNPEKAKADKEFPRSKHHFLSKDYKYIESFVNFIKDNGATPEKINLPYLRPEIKKEIFERINSIGGLLLTSSIPDNLEINTKKANKGDALKALCDHLAIAPQDAMAIGDGGNDIDMLKYAGCSVTMENGVQEAKEAARFTTDLCENYGFQKAVERFILS